MNSKKLNIIMVVCLILFSVILGISAVLKNALFDQLDKEHDQQQEQQRQEEEDKALEDASTTQKNEQTNSSSSSSSNSTETAIDFSTFSSMYTAAEKKLKNATNLYSKYDGKATISGPTNYGGISIENETVTWRFYRCKNETAQIIWFYTNGPVLDGLFELDYCTELYSDSAIFNYYFTLQDPVWQTLSKTEQARKFGWSVNDTFYSAPTDAIKNSSGVVYDKTSKTYTASAELDCSKASTSTRASNFYTGVLDASSQAKIQSCKITATVKENGSFSKIKYQEVFKVTVEYPDYNAKIDATVVTEFTEEFYSVDEQAYKINKPEGLE